MEPSLLIVGIVCVALVVICLVGMTLTFATGDPYGPDGEGPCNRNKSK